MRFAAVAFLLAFASLPAFAQYSGQYRACSEKARTQAEMTVCAGQEAARADAVLNHIYAELLSKTAGEPETAAKIKVAERAWADR